MCNIELLLYSCYQPLSLCSTFNLNSKLFYGLANHYYTPDHYCVSNTIDRQFYVNWNYFCVPLSQSACFNFPHFFCFFFYILSSFFSWFSNKATKFNFWNAFVRKMNVKWYNKENRKKEQIRNMLCARVCLHRIAIVIKFIDVRMKNRCENIYMPYTNMCSRVWFYWIYSFGLYITVIFNSKYRIIYFCICLHSTV